MVYFLAFLSLFCYFSRPFAKGRKNTPRILCFAFLHLLPFKAFQVFDKHPLILSQAAGRWMQPLWLPQGDASLGHSLGRTWVFSCRRAADVQP